MIDRLRLVDFEGLRILRLEDCRVFTVYRLASTLPQLKVLVAKDIRTTNDYWDWRPFAVLNNLEELMLWRKQDQEPRFFSLDAGRDLLDGSEGLFLSRHHSILDGVEDIYPIMEGPDAWGGYVSLSAALSDPMHAEDDDDDDDDNHENGLEDGGPEAVPSNGDTVGNSSTESSTPSEMSPTVAQLTANFASRRPFLPRLRRLALVNIPSPTTHLGTDKPVRRLIAHASTYLYWHDHNLLFPVLKTDYSYLRHLILVEPCESAWSEGIVRDHATAFSMMRRLESLTLIHPAIRRPYLIPILEALLQLPALKALFLAATEDTDCIEFIIDYLLHHQSTAAMMRAESTSSDTSTSNTPSPSAPSSRASSPIPGASPETSTTSSTTSAYSTTRWQGRIDIAIQDDLGANPKRRDWRQKVLDNVYPGLDLRIDFFRSEWEDEDAGIKRLCLQAWERTRSL
ncbi:hypothetical protein BGW41_001971 [Actinomortierella wolfii]|nr:hypothetical protein BGW41_001971 [Actinomortierella wolfii]